MQANSSNDSVDASNLKDLVNDDKYKSVKKVVIDGTDFKINNADSMFFDFSSLESVEGLQKIKFVKKDGKAVNVSKMFYSCGSLLSLTGIENWNMENVEDASSMFAFCEKLESIDLSKWQNVNISDASGMFQMCSNLESVKLFASQSGKLTKINDMFNMSWKRVKSKLSSVEGLEKFNTKNVTTMKKMFYFTSKLKEINGIKDWDTSKAEDMAEMFQGSGVEVLDLSKWKFPNKDVPEQGTSSIVHNSIGAMFDSVGLRDLSLPVDKDEQLKVCDYTNPNTACDATYDVLDKRGNLSKAFISGLVPGIWRRFKGKTGKVPGENIISGSADDSKYIRIVRDYIKVTFNRAEYGSVTCAVDVLQGKNKTYNLNNARLFDCVHNDSNSSSINDDKENDKKISAKELGEKREELAKYAESIGLSYTAKLIRNSKSSSLSALKNLLKEAESSRSAPMTFDQVKAVLGIDKKDTAVWNIDRLIPYDFIKKGYNNAYVQSTRFSSQSILVSPSFQQFVSNELVGQTSLKALADTVFTAIVTRSSKKTEPRPCIPQIINPAPQPGPSPTPLPEPKQELKPDSTPDFGGFSGFGGKPAIPNKTPGQSKCICPNAQENKLNKSDDSSSDGVRRGYLITTGTAATCWIISSIAALFAGFFAGLAIATRKFAAR
ncbi:bacterial surface protein 26-residue PARCEL repeat-containing domain protein [Gardnerella vaginalis]|uniref:Bacterial surface protein 26-residue PARCEL repeat-containing domain protein n=1 Tax=Gardnerella vaginalis TaxID=2702 RepID=A0A133NM57_GARVA|nr:bacterial surface protein 26-residue PARCEL repeat-containing domain protein [Gardnerella vaginalis]